MDRTCLCFVIASQIVLSVEKKFYETFSEPPVVIMTAIPQEFGLFPLSSGMVKGNEVFLDIVSNIPDLW